MISAGLQSQQSNRHRTSLPPGFREWVWDKFSEPNWSSLSDGAKILDEIRLASAFSTTLYSFEEYVGSRKFRCHMDPVNPDVSPLYNYRSEITRFPWQVGHALGTEEWLAWSYFVPAVTQHATEYDVFQSHCGSVPGYDSNSPAIYFGIQPQESHDWGTLEIVNKVVDTRTPIPSVRFLSNTRWDFVMRIRYGLGSEGLLQIWCNGVLIYDEIESTVWPTEAAGGSRALVGGNWKLGIYHHSFDNPSGIAENYALGHYNLTLYIGRIRNLVLYPEDVGYYGEDWYDLMDTSRTN